MNTGSMMTTSSEHEPEAINWAGYEAWREAVVVARRERRQRSERYMARHRRAPDDVADTQEPRQRSA